MSSIRNEKTAEELRAEAELSARLEVSSAFDASERVSEEEPACESLDSCVERLDAAINKHPLHREMYWRVLEFCKERKDLREIEAMIAQLPEFEYGTQNQYHLVCVLEKNFGLVRFELGEDGQELPAAAKEGLSDAEADELVWGYAFETTDVGAVVADRYQPQIRIDELLNEMPERRETYLELLEYFDARPRSYNDVSHLLKGRDVLMTGRKPHERPMQASVLVDNLERAGGVVWDGGWRLTDEGRTYLKTLCNSSL